METDNEFQLTAEVFTDIPMYSEVVPVTAVEAAEPAEEEQATDEYVFVLTEPLLPMGELTPFEQQTIDVMISGAFDPFDPFYVGEDGTIDTELFGNVQWAAVVLRYDLIDAGIAPENFATVAEQWLSV